jgi:PAS domain S-box-containing protein/putative nucleotidyltransferase with HDIG domain
MISKYKDETMGKPLRVLIVEDSEADALLTIGELKNGGYDPEYERVETAETMRTALREKIWDVILCDYRLPHFNGLAAITLLKETNIDIPLIIVSGTIGEETAVECMRLGVRDYIMKDNLSRLASAVERELKEAESRRQRQQTEELLRESEANYRQLFDNSPSGIYRVDFRTGKFLKANDVICKYLGCSQEEITSHSPYDVLTDDSKQLFSERLRKMGLGEKITTDPEYEIIDKNGKHRWLELNSKNICDAEGLVVGADVVAHEITDRKQAETELKESKALVEAVVENVPLMIFLKEATDLRFVVLNRAGEELLGYDRKDLMGRNNLDLFPPEQAAHFMAKDREVLDGEVGMLDIPEEPILTAKKGQRLLHTRKVCIKGADGKTKYLLGISEDITERKLMEESIQKNSLDLIAILDNLPFLAWLKDSEGRFMMVNEPFALSCGLSAANDLIGKTDLDIWPKQLAEAYRADDLEVMRNRQKKNVEEPISDRGEEKWFETHKAPLHDSKGNVAGTTGFSRDITERKRAETELRQTLETLRRAINTTIQVMVSAVEVRDPYTSGHQTRSADLARAIATEMGLSQEKIEGIRMAGSIHDIGKLSIPAEILSKPTKLTEIELSLIKEHAHKGFEMLKKVESPWPLAEIVYQHHERMDGSGYPRNLKGEEICVEARILTVADVVEAMASHRPYRAGLGIDAALEEIEKNSGIFYDSAVADACLRLFREKDFKLAGT